MKTALVTGGSRGIGWAIATQLVNAGYKVAINGIRDEKDILPQLEAFNKDETKMIYCQGNIALQEDRDKIIKKAIDTLGSIDVLVNNAGIAPRNRNDILEVDEAAYDQLLDTNLKGPFFLTQQIAKTMIRDQADADQKSIIFITSISATVASVNRSAYCISKAGLSMLSKLMTVKLAEFNIPVYEIRPGVIKTDMIASVREKYEKLSDEGMTLEGRLGEPDDIGKIVLALAEKTIPYATGQVITADGGMLIERL